MPLKKRKTIKKGINSIIKLLNLGKAQINETNSLSENEETNLLLYSLLKRFDKLENELALSQIENLRENINDKTVENLTKTINLMEKQILESMKSVAQRRLIVC